MVSAYWGHGFVMVIQTAGTVAMSRMAVTVPAGHRNLDVGTNVVYLNYFGAMAKTNAAMLQTNLTAHDIF